MKQNSFFRFFIPAICAGVFVLCGCESDKDKPGNASSSASSGSSSTVQTNSKITGTWKLTTTGSSWYIHFKEDGSWKITDDAAGAALRVYGSYKADGASFSGNMFNDGVGTGEIKGSYTAAGTMELDFIEHWHTPYKHVPYTGVKM